MRPNAHHHVLIQLDYRDVQNMNSTFFPYKCIEPIQMHGKQIDLAIKRSNVNEGHHFSNFGRSPVPNDLCKDSAPRHPLFWRRRSFKVCILYMGMAAILVNGLQPFKLSFHTPNLRRLHIKSEQHWPRGFRVEILHIFPIQIYGAHTNA